MEQKIIDNIEKVRIKNNRLWMNILRIAVKQSPEESKKILKQISENDARINKLTRSLSSG